MLALLLPAGLIWSRFFGVSGNGELSDWSLTLISHFAQSEKQSRKDAGIVQTTEPNAQDTFDARFLRTSKYNVASILLSKQKSWIDNWVTGSQSYDYSDFCYLFSAAVSRFVLIWFVCAEQWV